MRTPEQIIGKDQLLQLTFEGYVVVPVEPTQKMLESAFYDYLGYERKGPQKPAWNGRSMWAAMLRAIQERE
jgi:hypothetical protein